LELEGELADSDFGLLSGFGLPWPVKSSCYFTGRISDFRAAEHDLPSTGRTFEQPCPADRKEFLVLMAVTLSGSHPQAKAECRMKNEECRKDETKATSMRHPSHPHASLKPPQGSYKAPSKRAGNQAVGTLQARAGFASIPGGAWLKLKGCLDRPDARW
jgi:hypothetical protein